jgi:hypothetical protein
MSLVDDFKDIIKHTHSLGLFEAVKLMGSSNDAKIEAMDADRTVVLYGSMYQPITGIDSTVGVSRMAILKGYLDFPLFGSDKSNTTVITENRNNVVVPTEIKFDSGTGHTANYRFMSEAMVTETVKVPPFRGANWNISFEPEKKKISELAYFQGILGSFEKRFIVSVNNGTLMFSIGSGPTDRTVVPFATNITGTLKLSWSWPLAQVLNILKLSDTAEKTVMKFSDQGALMIEIDSGIGKYEYILPAVKG